MNATHTYATCATQQRGQPHNINIPLLGIISRKGRLGESSQDSIKLGNWVNAEGASKSDQFYVETINEGEVYWKVFIRENTNSKTFIFIISILKKL